MKFSRVALLGAATLAVAQPHNHAAHHHVGKRASPVEAREPSNVVVVAGPVVTVYELNGETISAADVAAGIKSGKYILVGETLQSVSKAPEAAAPTPAPTPSSSEAPKATSSAAVQAAAVFAEKKSSSSSANVAKPTTKSAPSSSSTEVAASPSATASSSSGSTSGHGDVNAEFPSGKVPCSTFPSAYGAVALDWLKLGGWSGVQNVPDYTSIESTISTIYTAERGSNCTSNSFCSYACPAGYQKSQWPAAQGIRGQSIGGLYCNGEGKLELSRANATQICTPGAGGVKVANKLTKNVAICRTDYPGTEAETIPLDTQPGNTYEVTNPLDSDYYIWEGKGTSAQYYINPAGASVSDACQWASPGSNLGNWAPLNMGVGKSAAGTFISIFRNAPTNTDGSLDFTITITGDVNGKCVYKNNTFYNNGVESPSGCTTGVTPGGTATFEFS